MANNQLVKAVDTTILKVGPQFTNTISKYQWALVPDSQLHAAKLALTKSDYIMKIAANSPEDVQDSIIKAGILGVDLTEGKRQAYLLPRKNASGKTVIQLQVGYKGVEAIHQRMGVIDRLVIRVVHENDQFDWSGNDAEKPIHTADWFKSEEERGQYIGAYAITYFPDGSIQAVTAGISEIYEKHRNVSDSCKSYQAKLAEGKNAYPPPWVTFEKAMIEKTMAYIASKQWPANYRNQETASKILSTLHDVDTADYVELNAGYTLEQKQGFMEFVENEDALGLYLFRLRVGDDVYNNLYNSGAKGEKTKLKGKVDALEKPGVKTFNSINEAIEAEDGLKVVENLDGLTDMGTKLLFASIQDDNVKGWIQEQIDNSEAA